jgi:hypothetical protein
MRKCGVDADCQNDRKLCLCEQCMSDLSLIYRWSQKVWPVCGSAVWTLTARMTGSCVSVSSACLTYPLYLQVKSKGLTCMRKCGVDADCQNDRKLCFCEHCICDLSLIYRWSLRVWPVCGSAVWTLTARMTGSCAYVTVSAAFPVSDQRREGRVDQ